VRKDISIPFKQQIKLEGLNGRSDASRQRCTHGIAQKTQKFECQEESAAQTARVLNLPEAKGLSGSNNNADRCDAS